MSKEKAKICLESALSEFGLYESLGIRDYLKSAYDNMLKALKELEDQNMKKRKISKWRIKRGVNFSDEMRKGKYGWNEAAHLGWF